MDLAVPNLEMQAEDALRDLAETIEGRLARNHRRATGVGLSLSKEYLFEISFHIKKALVICREEKTGIALGWSTPTAAGGSSAALRLSRLLQHVSSMRITNAEATATNNGSRDSDILDVLLFPRLHSLEVEGHTWTCQSWAAIQTISSQLNSLSLRRCELLPLDEMFDRRGEYSGFSTHWSHLTDLTLAECGLESLGKSLPALPRLQTLDLTGNILTDFDSLRECRHLEVLNLCNNKIADGSFAHTLPTSLRSIDLSFNRLVNAAGLNKLWLLEELNISHNSIKRPVDLISLSSNNRLQSLQIGGNPLTAHSDYRQRISKAVGLELAIDSPRQHPANVHLMEPSKKPDLQAEVLESGGQKCGVTFRPRATFVGIQDLAAKSDGQHVNHHTMKLCSISIVTVCIFLDILSRMSVAEFGGIDRREMHAKEKTTTDDLIYHSPGFFLLYVWGIDLLSGNKCVQERQFSASTRYYLGALLTAGCSQWVTSSPAVNMVTSLLFRLVCIGISFCLLYAKVKDTYRASTGKNREVKPLGTNRPLGAKDRRALHVGKEQQPYHEDRTLGERPTDPETRRAAGAERNSIVSEAKPDKFSLLRLQASVIAASGNTHVPLDDYLAVCRDICGLCRVLGRAMAFATDSVKGYITVIEEKKTEYASMDYKPATKPSESMSDCPEKEVWHLSDVMDWEIEKGIHNLGKKNPSVSRTVLRLLWFLEFVTALVSNLIEHEDWELSECAADGYNQTLAPRHPWVLRKVVSAALGQAPPRKKFLEALHVQADSSGKNDFIENTSEPGSEIAALAAFADGQPNLNKLIENVKQNYVTRNIKSIK